MWNGSRLGEWELDDPRPTELSIPIPSPPLDERNLLLLQFPDARAPASVGQGRKRQPRALGLEWLELAPAGATAAATP